MEIFILNLTLNGRFKDTFNTDLQIVKSKQIPALTMAKTYFLASV